MDGRDWSGTDQESTGLHLGAEFGWQCKSQWPRRARLAPLASLYSRCSSSRAAASGPRQADGSCRRGHAFPTIQGASCALMVQCRYYQYWWYCSADLGARSWVRARERNLIGLWLVGLRLRNMRVRVAGCLYEVLRIQFSTVQYSTVPVAGQGACRDTKFP